MFGGETSVADVAESTVDGVESGPPARFVTHMDPRPQDGVSIAWSIFD
jgi:hypothetical protein